jgi:SAM-dependent methyltransferase
VEPGKGAAEQHAGEVLHTSGDFRIVRCEACGFVHATPVPTREQMERLYRHEYYATEKPLYIERYLEDHEWWDLVHDDRLDDIEAVTGATGRLLDVGSGPGLLLERARARGWDVVGVEPSAQAAAHARALGLEVVEEFLEERLAAALGSFDAVHAAVLLEHLPDPAAMVRLMRTLLRPGGALVLVVPNDESPYQHAAVHDGALRPWWIAPPHHLNYFTPASLAALVRRTGFTVVDVSTSFPIDQFLLMGDRYVGDDALGRAMHGRRMAFELALKAAGKNGLRRDLYRAQAELGIGREACVVARRPEIPA